MDKVLSFLISVENDYKSEQLVIEQEIVRLNEQITHIENNISKIEKSIDESYVVMSSSQAANEIENTELITLNNLLLQHRTSLEQYDKRNKQIVLKLDDVRDVINSYKQNGSGVNFSDKLTLVAKLIKVDPNRAVEELNKIQKILK